MFLCPPPLEKSSLWTLAQIRDNPWYCKNRPLGGSYTGDKNVNRKTILYRATKHNSGAPQKNGTQKKTDKGRAALGLTVEKGEEEQNTRGPRGEAACDKKESPTREASKKVKKSVKKQPSAYNLRGGLDTRWGGIDLQPQRGD